MDKSTSMGDGHEEGEQQEGQENEYEGHEEVSDETEIEKEKKELADYKRIERVEEEEQIQSERKRFEEEKDEEKVKEDQEEFAKERVWKENHEEKKKEDDEGHLYEKGGHERKYEPPEDQHRGGVGEGQSGARWGGSGGDAGPGKEEAWAEERRGRARAARPGQRPRQTPLIRSSEGWERKHPLDLGDEILEIPMGNREPFFEDEIVQVLDKKEEDSNYNLKNMYFGPIT